MFVYNNDKLLFFINDIKLTNSKLYIPYLKEDIIESDNNNEIFKNENDINNNNYVELNNLINEYYHTLHKNNEKHFMCDRTNNKLPTTNFYFKNTEILELFRNKSTIQFIDKINKINDNVYEINLIDDIFFKNNLMMYVKINNVIYYVDTLEIKLKLGNLIIIGKSIKNNIVPNEKILEVYVKIFINNLYYHYKDDNSEKIYITDKVIKKVMSINKKYKSLCNDLIKYILIDKKLNNIYYLSKASMD